MCVILEKPALVPDVFELQLVDSIGQANPPSTCQPCCLRIAHCMNCCSSHLAVYVYPSMNTKLKGRLVGLCQRCFFGRANNNLAQTRFICGSKGFAIKATILILNQTRRNLFSRRYINAYYCTPSSLNLGSLPYHTAIISSSNSPLRCKGCQHGLAKRQFRVALENHSGYHPFLSVDCIDGVDYQSYSRLAPTQRWSKLTDFQQC